MSDDPKSTESKPQPPTVDSENESALLLERLKARNSELEAQVAAYEELEFERDAADKKAKSDKRAKAFKAPIAKLQVVGDGRRTVEVGQRLSDSECEGLTEGVHFDIVEV